MAGVPLNVPAQRAVRPPSDPYQAIARTKKMLRRWEKRFWPLRTYTARADNGMAHALQFRSGTSDYSCIRQIFIEKHYSLDAFQRGQEISDFVARRSASGERPLIIDAGANIGTSAVFFAMRYPGARIVAIEPEATNFALLSKNTADLDVRCLKAGLASSDGYVRVVNPDGTKWAFQTQVTEDATGIPCVTIPQIYEQECGAGGAFPFLVKIDIEGAEADVFARNVDWIAKTPVLIIELHDWLFPKSGSSAAFLRCIVDQPRDVIAFNENVYAIAHSLDSPGAN